MAHPVSPASASSAAQQTGNISGAGSSPSPRGVASDGSTIQSAAREPKKGIFTRIKDSIVNVFVGIKNAIKNVFYRLFFCKAPPSDVELKYLDFQSRLDRVDSLSDELALKEADEYPVVFTQFGRHVYKKSWNYLWKIVTYLPVVGNKTYYEIGRKEAQKNPKALIPHLKQYYLRQTQRLESQMRRSADSN